MMKNSNRYTKGWLVALFVLLTTLCRAENYTVTTAGTLSLLVGDKKNSITELTLSGQLNGTDFAFIREMSALKKLDMLNTEIVAGGEPYVEDYRLTADDILPSAVFSKWYGEMLAPLESVVLPKDITIIESDAFSGLETLKTVTLPEGLLSVGWGAFQSAGLTTVTFPSTLQVIDEIAFNCCNSLTSLRLPASLQQIGFRAFSYCNNLVTMTVDAANQHFAVQDNVLFTKDMKELLYYCCGLKTESYAIPEGVVKVGNGAFYDHPILRQVTFPSTLEVIGAHAFEFCGLTSLELPAALQEIGDYAFNCCNSLTSLHLPAAVQEIGKHAFGGWYELATVTVDAANQHFTAQDNVLYTKNMEELLLYPRELKAESYVIPEGVMKICYRAFADQPALKQVTLPSTLQELEYGAFMNVQLKEVILPDACQRIGGEAFAYNHALTTVSIPGHLTNVEYSVFMDCSNIAEITCKSRKPYSIEDDFFRGVDYSTCKLYVPAGTAERYRAASVWSNFVNMEEEAPVVEAADITVETAGTLAELVGDRKNSITELTLSGQLNGTDFRFIQQMTELIKLDMLNAELVAGGEPYLEEYTITGNTIPEYLFSSSQYESFPPLENIVLPKGITKIGGFAFSGLETLEAITLPEGLLSVGREAFRYAGLTTVTFPSTLQVIDDYAFVICHNLTSIHIPASLQVIGHLAFARCDNLATVTVDAANQHFAVQDNVLFTKDMKELLYYCCGLKTESYAIPEGVVKVGNGAFHSHPILRQVTFPSTLKAIDENAFNGCGLTSLELPAALQEIGDYAFNCCNSLTSLHLPASLQEIGYQAFAHCNNLATVTVDAANQHFVAQDNVLYTKDMKELLLYPRKLKAESYAIPEGVMKIRSRAFVDQPALKQVTLPSTLQELEEGAFMGVQLKEVILPDACQYIGREAFAYNHALTTVSIPGNLQDVGYAVFRDCSNIAEITCKSRKPYEIGDGYFRAVDYTTCKLYVPVGRSAAYREAPVWSNFTNIVEQAMVEMNGGEAKVIMGTAGELTALLGEQADGLTKLTIEGPINGDDVRCFRHIQSLKVLDLRKANIVAGGTYDTQIGSVVDVEAKANIITGGMFHGGDSWFTALEELYLPETATAVETHAFAINPSLRILHLGNVSAFTGTSIMDTRSQLEAVYCYADALPTLDGEFVFYESPQANATLFVSYGLKSAYEAAPEWGGFKEIREVANVKSPGTLATVLGEHVATDSLLCLAGDLNATDINTIRNMPMLKILDMRLANIVEGGEYYVYGNEPRTTQNNVVRGDMFQQDGMAAPLETVYLPYSTNVFEGSLPNTFIKHVWLNEGLQEITGQAFGFCNSLQELYIPASVKRMDTSHYWEHNYEIEVHPDNTAYASVDGVLYSKDMSKLLLFPGNRTGSFTVPASVKTVGNTAFASSRLTEVIMQEGVTTLVMYAFYSADALQRVEVPQSVTEVGNKCFNGCTGLLSVVWNTSASMIRAFQYEQWNEVTQQSDWFDMEINQPNAIIYVKSGVEVNKLWKNVVVDGMAEEIVLRGKELNEWGGMEQYSFYASKPFKAKKISYMYSFNRSDWDKSVEYETGRNISGGWQIITLPFTPTRIYHEEKGELAPFNSNVAGAKPFWLRRLTTAGFQSQTSIQPNTPYIIAMPNHKTYDEQYNIVGDVYFTAESEEGIDVAATPEMVEVEGAQYVMHGIYQPIFSEEYHGNESVPGIYCLNYDYSTTVDGKDYAIGSIFLRDRGMATAFTGYVTSKENSASTRAPLYYSIGDSGSVTGLEEIVSREDTSLKVYVLGKVLCIESETARQLSIYDATGRTIRQVQVKEGLNRVTGLAPGYYFMEGRKVLIK